MLGVAAAAAAADDDEDAVVAAGDVGDVDSGHCGYDDAQSTIAVDHVLSLYVYEELVNCKGVHER